MCTLVIAYRHFSETPLVVAANRDEFLNRPATEPFLWSSAPIPLVAPRDEKAGGTWLGMNAKGVFAAITNRFGASREGAFRSRGFLVLDVLAYPEAAPAAQALSRMPANHSNGFHMVILDANRAFIVWNNGSILQQKELKPGIHVLTERSFGAMEPTRELWIHDELPASPDLQAFGKLLSTHRDNIMDSTCVHANEQGYGTRSSTLLSLNSSWKVQESYFSTGAPCSHPYLDMRSLHLELGEEA